MLQLALFAAASLPARAETLSAPILRIEGVEFYANVGTEQGLSPSDKVQVLRRVTVQDAARRSFSESFPAGSAEVVEAGQTLSLFRSSPETMAQLSVGDEIRFDFSKPFEQRPAPAIEKALPQKKAAVLPADDPVKEPQRPKEASPEEKAFRQAFAQAAGEDKEKRAQTWDGYLERWPGSAMAPAIRLELQALKEVQAEKERRSAPPEVVAVGPHTAPEGEPVPVYLSVEADRPLRAASVYYRRAGEKTYRLTEMEKMGDTSYRGWIPADAAVEPALEWFVSALPEEGSKAQQGSAKAPITTEVVKDRLDAPKGKRSEARLHFEHVDFYSAAKTDQYSHFEGDFLYRINTVLYSVRVGFGVYNGIGGDIDAIEAAADPLEVSQPVGYNFGYTELEFKATPWLSLISRGLVGVDRDGMAAGMEGRIRLGPEAGTNLEAGAANIGNIGQSYLLRLSWDSVPKVPMAAGVHVTNQPGLSQDDYGVRLTYEARYAVTDWLEMGAQTGWQLRNINHAGPSIGSTAVFSW